MTRHGVRSAPLWAQAAWALALVQALFGLVLAILNRLTLERFFAEYMVAQTLGTIAFATAGLIIAARRPDNTIGRLLCLIGVGYGLTAWPGQYARYALVTHPGALPAGALIAWLLFWTWIPIVMLAVVFLPLLYPDGQLPSPRWRPAAWIAGAATLLLACNLALSPGPIDASLAEVPNPFAPAWAAPLLPITSAVSLPLVLISMACAVAAQVARFRRSHGDERQQVKWFACATAVLIAAFVGPPALSFPDFTGDTLLSGVALSIASPLLPAAVALAVLRYRLYDIDLLINRALVYAALSAGIAAIYVVVVGYLGALLAARDTTLISILAAGLVAVLFQPLRDRLQRGVNRLMYGERDDPYAVLTRLGQRLRAAIEPDEVLPSLVATVKDALRLPYAAVALRRGEALEIVAAEGSPRDTPLVLALTYQGELVGELLVSPRAAGEPWSDADRRLLNDLASHAGVAVHGVWAMAELRRARERLVLAREEERRRLRRDLHDDVAPSIAALGLTAAAIGELIPANPAAAANLVDTLQAAIRSTVGDLRRLVYNLRPPTLDELGLAEAIREHVVRMSVPQGAAGRVAAPEVRLDLPERLPPLPAAVEVAAFRLVQEALHNVIRHARAQRCVISLACPSDRALAIEVVDDGVGLPAERRSGVGLQSMRERAEELGGVLAIERARPRGTRVSAWLPIVAGHRQGASDGDDPHPDR